MLALAGITLEPAAVPVEAAAARTQIAAVLADLGIITEELAPVQKVEQAVQVGQIPEAVAAAELMHTV